MEYNFKYLVIIERHESSGNYQLCGIDDSGESKNFKTDKSNSLGSTYNIYLMLIFRKSM